MIEKNITFNGKQYERKNKIKGNKKIYIEYRNEELEKIKFFEVNNGNIQEVTDKDDLRNAIKMNYIIKE